MTEEFLHHIWKFRLFDQTDLLTTNNERVEILKPGEHNFDAGPDFFNARIKIDETIWAGNVEVHVNSSDWKKHKHQHDKAYDNIILHVVNKADEKLYRYSGAEIPTIEINERIIEKLLRNYTDFKSSADWVPCARQIKNVPSHILISTIDKLLLERLEIKAKIINNSLLLNHNNWEETFYQFLARNFGFKTNAEPFELLAKSLPSGILAKHKGSLIQIEALLYGQAGMLYEHLDDKYAITLQNEYIFLKQKFKLQSLDPHLWKFLRLRPVNFPSVRIAQFADLVFRSSHLFSRMLEIASLAELKSLLDVNVSPYWENHYMFNRESPFKTKHLGSDGINNIVINTIVPFLFVYGRQKDEEKYVERALLFLEATTAEQNSIIDGWKELNVPVTNAFSSQALLQLKNEYCTQKKCLSCNIGNYLIKNS
jgi:hypothetical protein